MSLITTRAGRVAVRMGGNTQETATLVDSLPDGAMIGKDKSVIGGSSRTVRNSHLCDCALHLTVIAGPDTYVGVYRRATVLACKRIILGQRKVVPWYSLQ